MRVLAIDPGYERLGIAIVEKQNKKDVLVHSECFRTSAKLPHPERLRNIGNRLIEVIHEFETDSLSIETLFFTNNQKTAMRVAEARGVILYTAASHNLKIFEYTPLQIKIAVTSYGKSDKQQMMAMIPKLIKINKEIEFDDEYDAIACGITCLASNFHHQQEKKLLL